MEGRLNWPRKQLKNGVLLKAKLFTSLFLNPWQEIESQSLVAAEMDVLTYPAHLGQRIQQKEYIDIRKSFEFEQQSQVEF